MESETLQTIVEQVQQCTLCPLHHGRIHGVPGEGPADARIMFIGEGPGYHENKQGRPFVGQAGQYLDELLAIAGLKREEVFIGNVVKCRPPQNRDPQPEEIDICTTTYLFQQIDAINPRVIVTLGRFSMGLFFPKEKISRIHGQPRNVNGRVIVPMLHPAAALHQRQNKPLIEEDFRSLPAILAQAEQEQTASSSGASEASDSSDSSDSSDGDAPPPQLEQLSMF